MSDLQRVTELDALVAAPQRTAVFLALVPGAKTKTAVAEQLAVDEFEVGGHFKALRDAGLVEDGGGTWSLTARGRELHAAYARSGRFRREQ